MSKEKIIAVTFKKPWRGYNKGETAGFDADTVERLLDAGLIEAAAQAKGRREKAVPADGGAGERKSSGKDDQPLDDQKGEGSGDDERP